MTHITLTGPGAGRRRKHRNRGVPAEQPRPGRDQPNLEAGAGQPAVLGGRWTRVDCGREVGTYDTAEDALDARDAHLNRYWNGTPSTRLSRR